ncbi:hypothetical protein Zmor_012762 [Zophobas morio]|uniref:Uncharacterized protein n=2 Tax=Zophobas morio TaxID=2755281 RepID=A0AA38MEZ5_9CUCU|nr:hypothetical protein Zmor_016769 [Zophobas morio]KAJ3653514.1 hypothetical protein Zmor_012762 [Zophobas morio]
MAYSQQGDKVFCFVCGNPAVKKRIYCSDCSVWSHLSCADKKKCCEQNVQTSDNDTLPNQENLVQTINSLSAIVNDMKKVIEELVTENKKLREEIEHVKSGKQQTGESGPEVEEAAVEEAVERIHRSHNVIIRGVPEYQGEAAQQKQADEEIVMNLIKSAIPSDLGQSVLNLTRLGKLIPNRCRIIKVEFNNPNIVKKLIRHRFGNNIFFNTDLTRLQQNRAFAVRKEFKRRRDNGENNIRLRYYNGMPKIVETKNE